ncbi:putative zinc finger protein At1g68190 [Rutidosis leptorrhynchoides]|uniref:putative zinc finger protein At1g68190 n=1 Tax=Rutidosis leptorrhynchoides TaxID=125765 RepID=UPI003A993888
MMDRYCEFCVNLRSVVFCKADAAYLCLSCDNKVHSANPLSNRHYRTLICDICRRRPIYIHCYDHHKFMCRACNLNQHNVSSQRRKRFVNSYMGCPTACDLGVLWGIDLNKFVDGSICLNHKVDSASSPSTTPCFTDIKEVNVVQQLVDLLKIQTCDVDRSSSIIRCQEQKVDNVDDQFSLYLDHYDMCLESCSSSFSKMDHLESETDLQGDTYWQCKSPILSNQHWSQNMQDLGVCEQEPSCLDDLNMPDIDLTFKNFEELFRIDHESTRVDPVIAMKDTSITNRLTNNSQSSPKKARYTSQIIDESIGTICNHDAIISLSCGSNEHISKDTKPCQFGYRKARSNTRKRTKSQSWKFENYESVTRI